MVPSHLAAPRENRGLLAVPPLREVPTLVEANTSLLSKCGIELLGQPLAELRRLARDECRAASRRFFEALSLPAPNLEVGPLVVTGHQPELFHPGVWVKNFAVHGLARRTGGASVNVINDSDAAHRLSLRVPARLNEQWRAVEVPFDHRPAEGLPLEELRIQDEGLFATLDQAVAAASGGELPDMILPRFWDDVRRFSASQPFLWPRLAAARVQWEQNWGCSNGEAPLSALCDGEAFAWFACHFLSDLPRFVAVHNLALQEYRRVRRIRSRTHPVPTLRIDGDWHEAPLWVWTADDPRRKRLLVRRQHDVLLLRYGSTTFAHLSLASSKEMVRSWLEMKNAGWKLRPRALTATLFVRLFMADVFVHGIGGAMYDQLTDEIIRRFYGVVPPAFAVLSATLRLPLEVGAGAAESVNGLRRRRRELIWKPERFLEASNDSEARRLLAEKADWIATAPATRRGRRERWRKLRELTERLRGLLPAESLPNVDRQLEAAMAAEQSLAVARDREYGFPLHGERELRGLMERVM